jgi:glycosyltransferase involved in cell wall biosynthesis
MRIALVASPFLPVPPRAYAGTERVIEVLAAGLHRRGHAVTLFAPGDSRVECELVPTIDRSLWSRSDSPEDPQPFFELTRARVWRERERFDVIHSHLEAHGFQFARHCPTPVVSTLHGRLDLPGLPELIAEFSEIPLVSVSDNQRRWYPQANWVATVHHGLALESMTHSDRPGGYLALVGRLSPEKGIAEAVQLARQVGLPLRVAAKQRSPEEQRLYREVLEPAVREGVAEYLGEIGPPERDALYAGALATLMLGAWPEPFGLVAIESLAAGTPVIARKAGALPEIIEHGVDGFLVDDVIEASLAIDRVRSLDRGRIRERALARFSADCMVDAYERVYRRVVEDARARRDGDPWLARRAQSSGRPTSTGSGSVSASGAPGFVAAPVTGSGPSPMAPLDLRSPVPVEQVADSLERPDGTARADGHAELASQPAGPDPKVVELAPRLGPHNAPKQGRTPGRRQRSGPSR